MAGKHHKDPQQIGGFLQTHRTTSASSSGHKSQGERKRIQSNRYLHKSCSLITVATIFIECAKDSKKLLLVSIPLSFHEMSSKDCLIFHESKNLLSLPHTEVFMHLRIVSGLSLAVPTDEITYTAKRFSN